MTAHEMILLPERRPLGLTLTGGRSVRIKAVNGYRGSRAVDRALGEARDWLATSTP